MAWIIIVFAALFSLAGFLILINPVLVFDQLKRHADAIPLYVVAIAVRMVLGVLLILATPESRFPFIISLLGIIALLASFVLLFMGHQRFRQLMQWALRLADKVGRMAGLIAFVFGLFLLYAFI